MKLSSRTLLAAIFGAAAVLASSPPSPDNAAEGSADAGPTSEPLVSPPDESELKPPAAELPEARQEEEAPRDVFTGRPVDGAPRFEKQAARSDRASMQWIVTKTMKRELGALGYTRPEIDAIDAQRAVEVIKLKIRRPSRGMPVRWRKDSAGSPLSAVLATARDIVARLGPALYVVLAAAAVGVAAQTGSLPFSGGRESSAPRRSSRSLRTSAYVPAQQGDSFEPAADRLWLDAQIDRLEWWLKNRARARK